MRKLPLLFTGLVFFGCQFSASCGNKNLDLEKGREFVSSTLEKTVGQKPDKVTCPEKVAMAKDATFECTASFGAANAKVGIIQTDDQGGVTIQSVTGVLVASKLETQIADQVGKTINAHVTVTCGERVRASVPGDQFMCDVKDARGASGKVRVKVEDTNGKASFEAVAGDGSAAPAEAPAAPAEDPATPPAPAP
jgi:hypothetical protein